MVSADTNFQFFADLLDQGFAAFSCRSIDDACSRLILNELQKLLVLVPVPHAKHRTEVKIIAGKTRDEVFGYAQLERIDDILADLGGGGRRQGNGLNAPQSLAKPTESLVVWTEVVSPFADAMGFVDRQKLDRGRSNRVQKSGVPKPFWCDINHGVVPTSHMFEPLILLGCRQRTIDQRGGNTAIRERVHLIFHQRNQRRHNDRQAGSDQTGQLVAKAFAAARRHYAQAIVACNNVANDILLAFAKILKAKAIQSRMQINLTKCGHKMCSPLAAKDFLSRFDQPSIFYWISVYGK